MHQYYKTVHSLQCILYSKKRGLKSQCKERERETEREKQIGLFTKTHQKESSTLTFNPHKFCIRIQTSAIFEKINDLYKTFEQNLNIFELTYLTSNHE